MEVPARLVSASNAIYMLPTHLRAALRQVDDIPLSREQDNSQWWTALEKDLRRAHTKRFVDDVWTRFLARDPEITASLSAVTSVISISDKVLPPRALGRSAGSEYVSGLAMVRPAGHHSTSDRQAPLCAINSVMVAALREAHAKGKPVGVLDIDVHFATGSQQIAMQWNERKAKEAGRVIVADVYAAMGPPARFVERVQREHGDLQSRGLDEATLRAEMDAEFASAKPHEREVVSMVCDSHLLFPHDKAELTDEALLEASTRSVEHFVRHGVEAVFVSLGLDAAAGDREGAQVRPGGFGNVVRMLRQSSMRSGFGLVLALEGGYHVGDLDVADVLSGGEEVVVDEHADRYLGSGNFGKCVKAVALALVRDPT